MKAKKLGQLLIEQGKLSAEHLEWALREQHDKKILLGDLLLSQGLLSKEDLGETLAQALHVEYINVREALQDCDGDVLKLVPRSLAVRSVAVPLYRQGNKLVVAMADPQKLSVINELGFSSGLSIAPRFSFRDDITAAIAALYRTSELETRLRTLEIDEADAVDFLASTINTEEVNRKALEELHSAKHNVRTPAVRVVSAIIARAVQEGASDIHVDPEQSGAVVRIRVDGMLRDILEVPQDLRAALISRIKILGEMDIAEKRIPQDGRVLVRMGQTKVDLRVSTLPTQYGEKAVIRLLNPEATKVGFVDLGLSDEAACALARVVSQPQGMLLVTGPTGSGKTTTLYAAVNKVRTRNKNVITVEDPVEYTLEGINQVQVNAKASRTFASCLRSILRQDPNVIMVGEIRDSETAEIALTAAQTGHMVLSTLHTNDSVSAIVRLLDLQIPPFLIASSVSAVIAQRLIRKLCKCSKQVAVTPEFQALLLTAGVTDFGERMQLPVGCPDCKNTGYKGRIGIYEILFVNEQTRAAIRSGAGPDEIRRMARTEGMQLMQEEALKKAAAGIVSLEEVFRVVPFITMPASVKCTCCCRDVAPTFLFCPYCGGDRKASHRETPAVVLVA